MTTIAVPSGPGPDLSLNKFAQMWELVDRDFQNATGKSLRIKFAGNEVSLVDNFLARLAPDEFTSSDNKRKSKKALEVVGFVLSFVKVMGGFAASAASMVFGPADMCFNAFSFLIDIPKKINKIYDDLIKLFSEMSTVLLEFQVLEKISVKKAELDDELLTTSHNLLITFVNICARYIKFTGRSKSHFVTTAFKSVFLDDDCGVLDELQKFQRLARQQSSMIGTVSFKHILDIEEAIRDYEGTLRVFKDEFKESQHQILDNVQSLVAYNKDKKDEVLTQKALTTIEDRLRVRSAVANASLDNLAQIQEDQIEGVCQWVQDAKEYQKWIQDTSRRHLLYIAGEAKTGKTYLLADIARRLKFQSVGDGTAGSARAVLYYTFPKSKQKRALDGKKDLMIGPVLEHLALQYAKQNLKYAEDLKSSLIRSDPLEEKDNSRLFTGFCDSLKSPNSRLFILLDDIDNLNPEQIAKLLSLFERRDKVRRMPRILMTGSAQSSALLASGFSLRINIEEHNGTGISRYIQSEVSKIENLQLDHPNIRRLRQNLIEKLANETNGSFAAIRQKLERVGLAIDTGKTEAQVLATVGDIASTHSEELVKEQLEKLERGLDPNDVEDLNRMLPWLVYGSDVPWIEELDALLLLYRSDRPVLPLEKRLQNKFSTIIDCRESGVYLRDEVKVFLARKGDGPKELDNAGSTISLQVRIDRADKAFVKHFLWDLAKGFDLDNPTFMDVGSEVRRPKIRVDEADAHFAMIEKSLQVLGEDTDEMFESLRRYGLQYLPDHLTSFLNSNPETSQKRLVCQKLIHFFSEPDILEQNWPAVSSPCPPWVDQNNPTTTTIETLFSDTLSLLEPTERRWVAKNVQKPECRGLFWQPITRMIAKKWLQEYEWNVQDCFLWIDNLVQLRLAHAASSSSEHNNAVVNGDNNETLSGDQDNQLNIRDRILRAAKWGLDIIGMSTPDATYYERLGLNFLIEDERDTAIEYFEKAQQMPGSGWRIRQRLAEAYVSASRSQDAATQLKAAIEEFQSSSDSSKKGLYTALLADLARVEQRLGEDGKEAALQHYQQIIELEPENTDYFREYLELLEKRSDIDGARQALSTKAQQDLGGVDHDPLNTLRARLTGFLSWDYVSDSFSRFMITVMAGHEIHETITGIVQSFIDETDPDNSWNLCNKMGFLYNMGLIFSNMKLPGAHERGMLYLEQCLKRVQSSNFKGENDDVVWRSYYLGRMSVQQLSLWRSLAIASTHAGQSEMSPEWEDFEDTIRNRDVHNSGWVTLQTFETSMTYLCRHYVMDKNHDKARRLVLPDVKDALVILEDNDPDNDNTGYWMLGEAFKLVGDDINALAAWSLIAPTAVNDGVAGGQSANDTLEKPVVNGKAVDSTSAEGGPDKRPIERSGTLNHYCDGSCETDFDYADDIWVCKHCPDIQLCTPCHELLKKDDGQLFGCHTGHDFLHIPPWSDDVYNEVGQDNVRIEGTLDENNRLVGGRVISVKEWLKIVRQMWSLNLDQTEDQGATTVPGMSG